MMMYTELVERVANYLPQVDESLLNRAYEYARQQHVGQTRDSGEEYFTHPLAVATIVTDLRLDQESVIAALLHDTIEDTPATVEEIKEIFGTNIGRLVYGLTKLKRIDLVSKKAKQGENLRKLLLAVADDVRVLLVKLADRLHNMRTLGHVRPERRERIAHETMDIYAPLAGRMGMQEMREELEELAFMHLYKDAWTVVHEQLNERRELYKQSINEIEQIIIKNLEHSNIKAVVNHRSKRPYAIYRKMEKNNINFDQLSDLIGFRVIVENTEDCYRALGVVHRAWAFVPEKFKDYISTPKGNDYRSIHTTIVGPSRQRVELQIRTQKMHDIAEYGIAAHTLYKDGVYSATKTDALEMDLNYPGDLEKQSRVYAWLRHTVETLADRDHPEDFFEQTKLELFFDQVFCFTPKGRLIAMPKGATAIDFAFAVHTDVGMSCIGVKINGKQMSPITKLKNGDEVNILCAKDHIPPAVWQDIVATGKARSSIRRATREARQKQYSGLGEKILETVFHRNGHTFDKNQLKAVLDRLAHSSLEDALAAVGRGEMPAEDVLKAAFPDYQNERAKNTKNNKPQARDGWLSFFGVSDIVFRIPGRRSGRRYRKNKNKLEQMIPVRGSTQDMPVKFNEECGAVPGDRIVGILTPDKGVIVYPINAPALQKYEESSDQWLDMRWDIDTENPQRFPAKIKMSAINQPGVLAEITEIIANNDININNLYMTSPHSTVTEMTFGIEVWDLKHLNHLIRTLRTLVAVNDVERNYGTTQNN